MVLFIMRDIFYTILIVWVLWRIVSSINAHKRRQAPTMQPPKSKQGETTVEFIPPKKKKFGDDEGEYVDYEEMK
ncbi:MAG: DUF4834 family protein [Bacteroidota bacterium]|nr:DUF4834 family protein [Bacteroidota bacterium]